MNLDESIEHTSFDIVRVFPAKPEFAFCFWSDPDLKARWNACHADWVVLEDKFDFQVGGGESKRWQTPDGDELSVHTHYLDIVPGERLIYAYQMGFAGVRLSASLVTIMLVAEGQKTKMHYTEQVAILSGGVGAKNERIDGTEEGMDRLRELIENESPGNEGGVL